MVHTTRQCLLVCRWAIGLLALGGPLVDAEIVRGDDTFFSETLRPFVNDYCTGCHGGQEPKADFALDTVQSAADVRRNPHRWVQVVEYLEAGIMPPDDQPRPTADEIAAVNAWITGQLALLGPGGHRNPGRVTIRRLNRAEYDNTIRDLIGVDFKPAADFPSDDVGYGFDNIGDVLSTPPILLERYLAAAEKIATEAIAVPGPAEPDGPKGEDDPRTATHLRIIFREPSADEEACASEILTRFAARAYRRPVTANEVARLAGFFHLARNNGETFEAGIRLAVQAALVSPYFLYRVELDASTAADALVQKIDDHQLASRLSYFLWSSMPDEELFRLAEQGVLGRTDILTAQVERMLADPRSAALVENFAGQWLQIRNLALVSPDRKRFKGFDSGLRAAMKKETELFFESVMRENRSLLDLLDADYTFLNERLAKHYGIEGVAGDGFRRVPLADRRRGGVLTQASILTITSNPTRTSPVKRGKWIMEQILGTPPPPPPPGVQELEQVKLEGTLRQKMEQHRTNAACAVCHARMDPLGFALENFDAVGAWRDRDGDHDIDASGILPGGQKFSGAAELRAVLKSKPELFARSLVRKMLTYALGRGLEAYDSQTVYELTGRLKAHDYRFLPLVLEVVQSEPFQMRRAKGAE